MKSKTFKYVSRRISDDEEMNMEINEFISNVSVEKILVDSDSIPGVGDVITETIVYNEKK